MVTSSVWLRGRKPKLNVGEGPRAVLSPVSGWICAQWRPAATTLRSRKIRPDIARLVGVAPQETTPLRGPTQFGAHVPSRDSSPSEARIFSTGTHVTRVGRTTGRAPVALPSRFSLALTLHKVAKSVGQHFSTYGKKSVPVWRSLSGSLAAIQHANKRASDARVYFDAGCSNSLFTFTGDPEDAPNAPPQQRASALLAHT